jgi:hypothetical protein
LPIAALPALDYNFARNDKTLHKGPATAAGLSLAFGAVMNPIVDAEPELPVETRNRKLGSFSPENQLVIAGYLCLFMGLLFLMAVFGLAGFVIGVLNFKRGKSGHGTIQIILGMTFVLVALVFYFTRSVFL